MPPPMPMLESPHLIISILYLTDRAANRTYHCVCARDGTSRQPGSQAIRINYTNCISMSRVLMDHRPRRRCSMLASRYPMLISIIVKITAQCTSNFVDGKEWLPLPLPVPQGTPRTRPRSGPCTQAVSVSRRLWPAAAPKARDTSGRRREKMEERKTKLGAAGLPIALARVVYCVGKFGGMFKQRNELVDKHHYGYLASTLDATTRICLPTSCTGSWTNIFGPTTRCRTRRGLGPWFKLGLSRQYTVPVPVPASTSTAFHLAR